MQLVDVQHQFAAQALWEPFDFQIRVGDRIGLVGPNGAGKYNSLCPCGRSGGVIMAAGRQKYPFADFDAAVEAIHGPCLLQPRSGVSIFLPAKQR